MVDTNDSRSGLKDIWLQERSSLQGEINWRLEVTYRAPVYYVSALLVSTGLVMHLGGSTAPFGSDNRLAIAPLLLSLLSSMYVLVLSGNTLVEKRLESYMLLLDAKIYELTEKSHAGWLSYEYGARAGTTWLTRWLYSLTNAGIAIGQFGIPLSIGLSSLIVIPLVFEMTLILLVGYAVTGLVYLMASLTALMLAHFCVQLESERRAQYDLYLNLPLAYPMIPRYR